MRWRGSISKADGSAFQASHLAAPRRCPRLSAETIPALSRSALHRCLVRHGISRLPRDEEKASKRQRFAEAAIGYVHIDVCELRLAEGKLHMFLAIDRVSKFVHVAFYDADTKLNGAAIPKSRRSSAATSSTGPAASTASRTGSPSPTTRGRTARPSG